jgi:cytoskeletal protein CcmA (bactofilin family)
MPSSIHINGLEIDFSNGELRIKGLGNKTDSSTKELHLDKNGVINGNVEGSITIKGNNVVLQIKGNVDGNVTGQEIVIEGDIDGNVTGQDVYVKGDIDGNVIGQVVRK